VPCAQAAEEALVVVNEFHVTESGRFGTKQLVRPLSLSEVTSVRTQACSQLNVDCGAISDTVQKSLIPSTGPNFYITGTITKHSGEEWYGLFRTPDGYEICDARLDLLRTNISGPSTFNTAIVRSPGDNGLGFYAVIPKERSEPQWVDAYFAIKYVKAGTTNQNNCALTGSNPWLCKGQSCNR
jgi:hypothetical protein